MALLEAQNLTREPDLIPVRHGRMMVSPFTFYRGAAKIMAADLKDTPIAGLNVQLCGDAHLSNFGVFASPERALLFDLNDFDETLPGPFEYDVKRMAASFTIAGRNNGFTRADSSTSAARLPRGDDEFAAMGNMEIWYARLSEDDLMKADSAAAGQAKTKREAAQAKQGQMVARRPRPRRTPVTVCRRCPSSGSWWTVATGSSASRRWWFPPASWRPCTGIRPSRFRTLFTRSSAPIG